MIILLILIFIFSTSITFAYTPPIGIPEPSWGINDPLPGRPADWTKEVAGYYFVDQTSISKGVYGGSDCVDVGNTYGYLGRPRCSLPLTMKKGSRIEIYGPFTSASNTNWISDSTAPPNGNEWSANADGPAWVTMPDKSGTHYITGSINPYAISYLYFDSIFVKYGRLLAGSWGPATGPIDHVMIRNSKFDLEGLTETAIGFDGSSTEYNVSNMIVYKNDIMNVGDMESTADNDDVGIGIWDYTSYAWVLENTLTKMSAVSIYVGGLQGGDPQYQHHFYVGKNTITDGNAYGVWSKHSSDTIFSENIISNIHDFPTANTGGITYGNCMGGQYGLYRVWYINNKCSAATSGGRIQGPNGYTDFKVFFIGNVIYDIGLDYIGSQVIAYDAETAYVAGNVVSYEGEYYVAKGNTTGNLPTDTTYWNVFYPNTDRPSSGIIYAGTGVVYIVNNTMYDVSSGIIIVDGDVVAENNIISNLNESAGYHFWHKWTTEKTIVFKNNNVYGATSTKFRIGGAEYTDLADFIADTTYGDGSISTDPSFVSPPSNMRLGSGSGAIGTALPQADLTDVTIGETTYNDVYAAFLALYGLDIRKDIGGTTRPQNTTWDMGAYEYDPGAVYPAVSIGAGAGVSIGSGATMTLY